MADTTLKDRALIRLSGEEARPFLQGLVTQDVLGLEVDAPRWSGLLTPQGKALFDFVLWADGDDVLVDCEETQADALAKRRQSPAAGARRVDAEHRHQTTRRLLRQIDQAQ